MTPTPRGQDAATFLGIAVKRMVGRYPFHAHLLSLGRFVEDNKCPSMGVTVSGGELLFLFNAEFVLACSLEHMVGVLHHEVLHVVFGHLLADPKLYPDIVALLIAEEVTVNEFVPEQLPGTPIRLEQFPQLPALEDTDTRYRRLASKRRGIPVAGDAVDDHQVWESARAESRVTEAVTRGAVARAAARLTSEERASIPDALREAIETAGLGSLDEQETVSSGGSATISWQMVLRRFVGRALARQPSYLRPARRFPDLVGVIPGSSRAQDKPRVMAVIDTSGSVSNDLLGKIARELERVARSHQVTVVECDERIQRVYPFNRGVFEVRGRGGTDLCPPLRRKFLREHRPDLVVYFTDGYGPAPAEAPQMPVLWCLTPGGRIPARWGETVWME